MSTHPPAVTNTTNTTTNPPAAAPRKVRFNVGSTYTVQDVIGEGAYGVVVSAIHRPSGGKVAIKKVSGEWFVGVGGGSGRWEWEEERV